jgi:hypothetical protein
MDDVREYCFKAQKKAVEKYGLDNTQAEILNTAIMEYDYEVNDGMIFTDQFGIISLFCSNEDDTLTAPTCDCIFALCEWIVETSKYYNVVMDSQSEKIARTILTHSVLY